MREEHVLSYHLIEVPWVNAIFPWYMNNGLLQFENGYNAHGSDHFWCSWRYKFIITWKNCHHLMPATRRYFSREYINFIGEKKSVFISWMFREFFFWQNLELRFFLLNPIFFCHYEEVVKFYRTVIVFIFCKKKNEKIEH